jgi:hypothetical protein
MSREKPQAATPIKHPDEYERDLNPNVMTGQNIGIGEFDAAKNSRNAYDHKEAHQRLANLTDDNLRQIRVLEEGRRLKQGATYVDLNALERGEFTATGDMTAEQENLYVAKQETPYHLWSLLIGVENPERLADASDKGAEEPSE